MARGSALITGASSGIGAELAKLCASDGYNLILVARRAPRLQQLADELARRHGISARIVAADLSDPLAPDAVFDACGNDRVDLLINNAGLGVHGRFTETNWQDEERLLRVNVEALVRLTKLFLPGMEKRGSGRVLNVASTAAFVPGPLMALYYASKSFVLSFSLALANEMRGTDVTVSVLCPGPTRTEFDAAARISGSRLFEGPVMSAIDVAREGYRAMMAGKPEHIAGARNRWTVLGTRLAPRTVLAALARQLNSSVQ
jgi:short-subunit dehydrogenase